MSKLIKIATATDKASLSFKENLNFFLNSLNLKIIHLSSDLSQNNLLIQINDLIIDREIKFAIFFAQNGLDISIKANRNHKIKALWCDRKEILLMAKQDNLDANILILPSNIISKFDAMECIKIFSEF